MELKIEVTEEQIKEALDRQVRVALGHLFQTKEINDIVREHAKARFKDVLKQLDVQFPMEVIEEEYVKHMDKALVSLVRTRVGKL